RYLPLRPPSFHTAPLARDTPTSQANPLSLHDALPIWQDVGLVIAARDIDRGSPAAEALDAPETAYDGVYVMDSAGRRILAVSSRFFGPRAQEMTLRRAREAGVRIEHIDAITRLELREQAPQALSFVERNPNLLA